MEAIKGRNSILYHISLKPQLQYIHTHTHTHTQSSTSMTIWRRIFFVVQENKIETFQVSFRPVYQMYIILGLQYWPFQKLAQIIVYLFFIHLLFSKIIDYLCCVVNPLVTLLFIKPLHSTCGYYIYIYIYIYIYYSLECVDHCTVHKDRQQVNN